LRCLLENQKTSCSHKGSHTIFRVLGKKIILNIKRLLSILYYSNTKIYLKKSAKDLHISINPLIFAPRLRDNASEKEGSLGEWLKPPVC
jgi:hypothetical protein